MDNHQASLTSAMSRNSDQEARHVAHSIRTALGKLDIDATDVDFWDDGRGKATIERFEDLIGAEIHIAEESGALFGRKLRNARRELYTILFDGIDFTQAITQAQSETILDRVMARPSTYAAVGIVGPKYRAQYEGESGTTTPVKRPKRAGAEVHDILARCGVKVMQKRARIVPVAYLLYTKEAPTGTKKKDINTHNGRGDKLEYIRKITLESMGYMSAILKRRNVFDIDEAIASLNRTYEPQSCVGPLDKIGTVPPLIDLNGFISSKPECPLRAQYPRNSIGGQNAQNSKQHPMGQKLGYAPRSCRERIPQNMDRKDRVTGCVAGINRMGTSWP